jgi:hypothetical protein
MDAESRDEGKRRRRQRIGCLLPLVVYVALLVPGYFLTLPPAVTEDFSRHSRSFSIAGVRAGDAGGEVEYLAWTLARVARGPADAGVTFLLPEPQVTIDVGDIHRVRVLEEHGDWQLVEYDYANTHTSTSVYRAYRDRVEPVSYRVTSSIAHAFLAMVLIVPAYLVAAIIIAVRNRRARRTQRPG